jgi:uncharacterized protein YodC (DUF2158 family)
MMVLKPGDIVTLKSGGHPMTVIEVNDGAIVCLWMGTEGELYRETLPLVALESFLDDEEEEEDEEDEDDDEE